MKIFLDTNILIDFLAGRDGKEAAAKILSLSQSKEYRLCASVLTFANIAYILRKLPEQNVIDSIYSLTGIIGVLKMDEKQLLKALMTAGSDFEDNLQYQCAKAAKADVIITNNTKHFKFSEIPIFSSSDFTNDI